VTPALPLSPSPREVPGPVWAEQWFVWCG